MDSGRFLLAVILMIAVVILTNVLFPPVRRSPAPLPGADTTALVDTLAPPEPGRQPDTARAAVPPPAQAEEQPSAAAAAPSALPADTMMVSSPLYRFGFSTRGGGLVSAQLLGWEQLPGKTQPVQLVPASGPALLRLRVAVGNSLLDLSTLAFRAEPASGLQLTPQSGPQKLALVHEDTAGGWSARLVYTFHPDSYLVDVRAEFTGLPDNPQLRLVLGPTLHSNEAKPAEDARALGYVVDNPQQGIHSVRLHSLRGDTLQNGPLNWFALKNKYFVVAALRASDQGMPFGGVIARSAPPDGADISATLLPSAGQSFGFRLYIGPQQYERLARIGDSFEDVSPFGWKVLRPVLRPLAHAVEWALLGMHRVLGLGYGWVLILFGVLIRIVLWPLNAKAMRSQMKNMELQPRIKDIQTRYKKDPEKLQKEMLRLYKEEGFNPMGGCLPMLIPFPVLITLFYVFQGTIEFRGVGFLWLPDLSQADPLYILPILLGLSMFIQQWLSSRITPQTNAQMKGMMYFMPIFMTVIFLRFAAGLNLYYAAQNLASVPQQYQLLQERRRWQAKKSAGGG